MTDAGGAFEQYKEIETGEAFTPQGPVRAEGRAVGDVGHGAQRSDGRLPGRRRFEHKGGGFGRMIKKAASGEGLRLMKCTGSGELFLANRAMLVHVLRLEGEELTVNGENILAFEDQIGWDVTRVKGGAAGMLAGGLFNIVLHGSGLVALTSDGQPMKLDVSEAPTFADPSAAIAWSGGVTTTLKTDVQAKSLIGLGSGESVQLGFAGRGWVLVQPSEGRRTVAPG